MYQPLLRHVDDAAVGDDVVDALYSGEGLVLSEIRKGHTVEEIQAAVEPVLLVSPDLKEMEED